MALTQKKLQDLKDAGLTTLFQDDIFRLDHLLEAAGRLNGGCRPTPMSRRLIQPRLFAA